MSSDARIDIEVSSRAVLACYAAVIRRQRKFLDDLNRTKGSAMIELNAANMAKRMTVKVRVKGMAVARFRIRVGLWFIRLGAYIGNFGAEINDTDS